MAVEAIAMFAAAWPLSNDTRLHHPRHSPFCSKVQNKKYLVRVNEKVRSNGEELKNQRRTFDVIFAVDSSAANLYGKSRYCYWSPTLSVSEFNQRKVKPSRTWNFYIFWKNHWAKDGIVSEGAVIQL